MLYDYVYSDKGQKVLSDITSSEETYYSKALKDGINPNMLWMDINSVTQSVEIEIR